ncbi:hypothetical protein [Ligilactobacillus agilis]
MYPSLSKALANMDWLNPFDYYELILTFFKIFGQFQVKLAYSTWDFFQAGYNYGAKILPHHHPILLSGIIFLYFAIFIVITLCLCIIVGSVLCIANMFATWIVLLSVYVIFWRNKRLLEPQFIAFFSALWFITDFLGWW